MTRLMSEKCVLYRLMIKTKKATTDSVTFRLNSSVLNKLEDRATQQKTSLNVLVNQILSGYVEWEMDSARAGWIPMQRSILTKMIEVLDEKDVYDIAEKAAVASGKDSILYMYGKYNLESLLSNIRISAQRSGFSLKEYNETGGLELVIQHDLGWKWSLFFKMYYQKIMHDLNQRTLFDYTDTSLVISLVE